ncbi:MAG: DivIVA domain-containing protein [Microbacteriaceae bacterium]|nr:DivIVA domain-containing protein [Microbacteriaceae bacterium]
MDAPFPRADKGMPGYDPDIVTEFLERAKRVFEGQEDGITSQDIRHKVFPLVTKDGFQTKAVDEALWRLEEAFADKERLADTETVGEETYYAGVRERAQEILDRTARPPRAKFRAVSKIRPGYHPGDVDEVCEEISRYFQQQGALSVTAVRRSTFRTLLGGYDEKQVDALLDETVSVMLAVR